MSEDLDVILVAQVTNNLDRDSHIHHFLFLKDIRTVENPHGCQQCTCNPLGTFELGGGCNEHTGECQCKRNVARVRDCVCQNNSESPNLIPIDASRAIVIGNGWFPGREKGEFNRLACIRYFLHTKQEEWDQMSKVKKI